MVIHIVSWNVLETDKSKEENIAIIKENIESLFYKIPNIRRIEVGINYNLSDQASDIVLYSEFDSKEDLDNYQIHPEHLKVVEIAKKILRDRVVVDYEK